MKSLASIALMAALVAAPTVHAADAELAPDISRTELHRLIDARADVLLLDVRSTREYAGGRIPGSVNVPIDALPAQVDAIRAKDADTVVVYCAAGPRALKAQETLRAGGVANVQHLQGDMNGWRAAGLPIERNPAQ